MQSCIRQSVPKVVRVLVYGQHNYHTNGTQNNMATHKQQEHDLICSDWEEAIIREHRMPDMPFDSMQKNTIDQIHNHKNYNKEQSNGNGMMKSSE